MAGALDGLPKQFVHAMRTLFDIMDDKRTGFIKFSEIENRWRDDGTKGLPKGVIDSLRKVTPLNGLLSFERFCTGLKICLLHNQKMDNNVEAPDNMLNQLVQTPSVPLLDVEVPKMKTKPPTTWGSHGGGQSSYAHRTVSMPQLISKDVDLSEPIAAKVPALLGPPKPPRLGLLIGAERSMDKVEIRTALQNWQMGLLQADAKDNKRPQMFASTTSLQPGGRSLGDGKSAVQGEIGVASMMSYKKGGRRREPRRHTLQNGIDYNMLRRMKQLEQEKDVLLQGLQAVERARDWYLQQLAVLNDKMRFLGRDACYHSEQWSEAQSERLGMQRARVLEVNRQLAALTNPSVPLHMNLAVGGSADTMMSRLKQQNHMLSEEVHKKSEHISSLEREKASLIRELFQARTQQECD